MPRKRKPCPPLDLVEAYIRRYHSQGVSFDKMVVFLRKHYDTDSYGLGKTRLKVYAKMLGLKSARSEGHTSNTIATPISELRVRYPNAGAELLRIYLRDHYDMRVSRILIQRYLKDVEPDQVAQRRANRLVRRTFYAAGVNHFWSMDQHDKWKRFGLFWHGCVDGFTGKILWLVVWWTNSNPRFVCAQYLDAVRVIGGGPCVTQSDRGTENYNVAYAHTHIRHALDPTLAGTIQHNWKFGHSNVKPEQMWWRFRRTWVPGFERLLEQGVKEQWYDIVNVADKLVFRWLAIPWLQKEADSYVYSTNNSRRRANRRKVLPNGIPDVMFENPESVGALDFKIIIPDKLIEDAEHQWAPPNDVVFHLVPPRCEEHISSVYAELGSPGVEFESFWQVYNQVRGAVDEDILFEAAGAASDEENASASEEPDANQLPLHHLESCEFGKNGVPAAQSTREEHSANSGEGESDDGDDLMVEFTDNEGDELY